jgi:hypothetical protein
VPLLRFVTTLAFGVLVAGPAFGQQNAPNCPTLWCASRFPGTRSGCLV